MLVPNASPAPVLRPLLGSSGARRGGAAKVALLGIALVECRAAPSAGDGSGGVPHAAANGEPARVREAPPPIGSGPTPAGNDTARDAPLLDYVEVMTGGATPESREPLVIALHGLGDRPERFVGVFEGFPTMARIVAPHSKTQYYEGYSWFDFRREDPDFSAPGIRKAADDVAAFATSVASRRPTIGKPIVVGFSQGGAIGFALAALHPDAISAAFPIGGWFPAALWPGHPVRGAPPIVLFHGTADPVVPVARMRPGAARLSELGFSVEVREFSGVGHAIPEQVQRALFDALAKACEHERGPR